MVQKGEVFACDSNLLVACDAKLVVFFFGSRVVQVLFNWLRATSIPSSDARVTSSFLFLVVRPGAATSSVLAPC